MSTADRARIYLRTEAEALSVFFNFFNIKKWFVTIFYQVNNLFLHKPYFKSPFPAKFTWQIMKKIFFD